MVLHEVIHAIKGVTYRRTTVQLLFWVRTAYDMSLLNYGFWGMFNIRVPCAREKHQTIKPYRENCQSRGDRLDFLHIFTSKIDETWIKT
jgi:hypothetical protein